MIEKNKINLFWLKKENYLFSADKHVLKYLILMAQSIFGQENFFLKQTIFLRGKFLFI